MCCTPRSSTLFPYTTLFRSPCCRRCRLFGFRKLRARGCTSALRQSSRRSFGCDQMRSYQSLEDYCSPFCRRKSRSEEHTSELQSLRHLVCRLLLEKKKQPTC